MVVSLCCLSLALTAFDLKDRASAVGGLCIRARYALGLRRRWLVGPNVTSDAGADRDVVEGAGTALD